MKVSVCSKIIYQYEVDVPDDIIHESSIIDYCDSADPVLHDISSTFNKTGIDYNFDFVSIINEETGEFVLESD
jgi:hypothetical protein